MTVLTGVTLCQFGVVDKTMIKFEEYQVLEKLLAWLPLKDLGATNRTWYQSNGLRYFVTEELTCKRHARSNATHFPEERGSLFEGAGEVVVEVIIPHLVDSLVIHFLMQRFISFSPPLAVRIKLHWASYGVQSGASQNFLSGHQTMSGLQRNAMKNNHKQTYRTHRREAARHRRIG